MHSHFIIWWFAWGEHKSAWLDKKHEVKQPVRGTHPTFEHFCPPKVQPAGEPGSKCPLRYIKHLLEEAFFPLLSVWDSGSIYKHYTVSRRVKSPHEFLNSFFLLTELLRDIYGILRDRQALNFNQNRADQFGFVSASPEVVVSMFSCHWKSAWNPLRQKPPLIFSPLRSSPALPACSSSPPPSALCLAFWLTMMEIKGQCELKALLPHLNLIKVNLASSLACDSLHAAWMSHLS